MGAAEPPGLGPGDAAGLLGAGKERKQAKETVGDRCCCCCVTPKRLRSYLPAVLALAVSEAALAFADPLAAAGLVPFGGAVRLCPAGFFSDALFWLLAALETVATPAGLLGTAPAAEDGFAAAAVLFAATLFSDLASLTPR